MKVLLSIKPEFADLIFSGKKKFEFRKAIFKNPSIQTVVVYSSSPVQRIIGEFDIEKIICDDVSSLWKKTKKFAGIDEEYFFRYFENRESGFAIQIKSYKKYKEPLELKKEYDVSPPQSFLYLE